MTLVVPCLDNIFMVLLISELAIIGVTKPMFLDSGYPRVGGWVCACVTCFVMLFYYIWLFVFDFTVREFLKFGSIMLIKNPICLCSYLLIIMVAVSYTHLTLPTNREV